jgi:DNA-binding transcriptional LysR family regulator
MTLATDDLRCFVEAARLLSFRAAARAVALSPAAFGQHIQRLEHDLGDKLFHRTTRSVVLTHAGLSLLPYAQRALQAVEDCRRAAGGQLARSPIELVLGTRHELGMSWIVPMLDRLQNAEPSLILHLYFGSGPDLVRRVRSLEVDCAVTSTRLTDPKLDAVALHEERYAFVGESALLKRRPLTSEAQAASHTLFDTTEELPLFKYWRDARGSIESVKFRRVIRLGTIDAIRYFVLRGKGVAVLPEYFVARDLQRRRLTRVLPKVKPLSDYFRLVFRSDDPRRSLYTSLAEVMQRESLK